jgi:hypothetical protein
MPGVSGTGVSTHASALVGRQLSSVLELRRARAAMFGQDLFSDPAWDILLQLFAASLEGRRLGLGDFEGVCPATTLARWLTILERRGLVACNLDCSDPENFSLELSSDAAARLSNLLRDFRLRLATA